MRVGFVPNSTASQSCGAVLLAAGRGTRSGGGIPKQYRPLAGYSALERCLSLLTGMGTIAPVQLVIHPDDQNLFVDTSRGFEVPPPVSGGATRQASVLAGLE